jgi:hypothetical protein
MSSSRYVLLDPRPIAKEAPYTFFLPPPQWVAAVKPGDKVYLDFEAVPRRTKWESERMWVVVSERNGDHLVGVLDHEPDDMPGVSKGEVVAFETWHILQIDLADPEANARLPDGTREYWERCLVDQAVIDGELQVEYIYREAPDPDRANDDVPDSGWRIRGDMRDCTDDEIGARAAAYVALGAVLNQDDSWLHLIDEPVGAAFERDFDTDTWVAVELDS